MNRNTTAHGSPHDERGPPQPTLDDPEEMARHRGFDGAAEAAEYDAWADSACRACDGGGTVQVLDLRDEPCGTCGGSGKG